MNIGQYWSQSPSPLGGSASSPPWQSFTSLSDDQLLRIIAYALQSQLSLSNSVTNGKKRAAFMQGWNADLQLTALAYFCASSAGLSTNGPSINATVDAAWGGANGIVDADTVKGLMWYLWLYRQGMTSCESSLPTVV